MAGPPQGQRWTSDSALLVLQVGADAFQAEYGVVGVLGWRVKPNTVRRVTFRSREGEGGATKFKILTVASC